MFFIVWMRLKGAFGRRMGMDVKKLDYKALLKILFLTVLIEVTILNFRHWESLLFPPMEKYDVTIGDGIKLGKKGKGIIKDAGQAYIEFKNIDQNVKNLFLDLEIGDGKLPEKINVAIQATDMANKNYFSLPEREIINGIVNSKYIRLHLSGKSSNIKINLLAANETLIQIAALGINVHVPFRFDFYRFIVMLIVFGFLYCFVYNKEMFLKRLDLSQRRQRLCVAFCVIVQMLCVLWIGQSMQPSKNWTTDEIRMSWPAHSQYNELADALIDGKVYLKRKPPESLSLMENPYDMTERNKIVVQEHQERFDWDYAYFKGKYYSYFGVVPALLFFIPFKLLTGSDLWTWDLVTMCGIAYCIASFFMIYQFAKKYFQEANLGNYILLSSFYIWGSAITYLVHYGNVYSCPIMISLLFGTLGLGCYVSASDGNIINKFRLTMGALLIALIMGCRPHLAIVMLFAFPVFWHEIKEKRLFFSKKGIVNTCCVIVPFLIVGIFLMWYNYVRFESVFDFGANYNLTSNDMTHRGIVFERWPLGVFIYLFYPLKVTPQFPFLQLADLSNDYMGYTSKELVICGFFSMNFLALISFWIWKIKRILKRKNVFAITAFCFASAIVIMLADIQLSGITQRYMSDFGWLFILSANLILLSLDAELKNTEIYLYYCKGCAFLIGISICLNIVNLFIVGRYGDLINMNPRLYYTVKFWMPFY